MQVCSFLPLCVASDLAPHSQREKGETPARRGQSWRRSRKASCQPPAERKTTGHQLEWFGKRTSQGRFQLAQHAVIAVSHRGSEEVVRGSFGLMERRKRKAATNQDWQNLTWKDMHWGSCFKEWIRKSFLYGLWCYRFLTQRPDGNSL